MSSEPRWMRFEAPGGRWLEVLVDGDVESLPLVFHGGTPFAACSLPHLFRETRARGLGCILISRPGYAESTPRPGRSVADVATDVAAVLDALGADEFLSLGWSGGGPHALACAALLPERCRAATALAGVAPYPAESLDWFSGMGSDNVEEFGRALRGEPELVPFLTDAATHLATVQAADLAGALGDLVPPVDRDALSGELAECLAEGFRRAVSSGIAGWRDDDLAFTRDWGVDLSTIACPVTLWQGGADRMVPAAHAEWLAARIPSAKLRRLPGEGHISLFAGHLGDILDDLLARARRAGPV